MPKFEDDVVIPPPVVVAPVQAPWTPPEPPKKIVWITCRASNGMGGTRGCEGRQAEVVYERANNPVTQEGGFEPNAGGRAVRYKCLTCRGSFHINS